MLLVEALLSIARRLDQIGLSAVWPVLVLAARSTLLLTAAWAVSRMVRSAASRHLVWAAAFAVLLVLPLGALLPAVELEVLPAAELGRGSPSNAAASPATRVVSDERSQLSAASAGSDAGPPPPAAELASAAGPAQEAASATGPAQEAASAAGAAERAVAPRPLRLPASLLVVIWLLGVGVMSLRLMGGLTMRRRLLAASRPAAPRQRRRLRRLAAELGIDRPVRLAVSDRVQIPLTWGLHTPVVVLPASASGWSEELLDSVLLHELAHVRRNDAAIGLGAAWVRALYWPHPMVWTAYRALRRESEVASDDAVIRAAVPPVRYAEHLLHVVEELRRPVPQTVAAMATRPQLTERIGSILDPSRQRAAPGRRTRLVAVAGATVALLLTAVPVKPIAVSDEAAAFATLGSGAERSPVVPPATAPPDRVRPLAPAPARTTSSERRRLFDGSCGDGSSSTSVTTEEDWLRIRVTEGRCEIRIESTGTVEFTADERAVRQISPGGRLVIEERRTGATRRLEVAAGADGRAATVWKVDGETVPFDRAAEAWLAGMIPQIYRLTGWQAEERVERILAAGGVDAVLAEVRLIHGDHVQAIYLVELLERAALAGEALAGEALAGEARAGEALAGEELERWLGVAGAEIGSDHELARVLMQVSLGRLSEAGAQRAFVTAASTIGSDHALRETLDHLVRHDELSTELLRPLLRVAGTIGSDFELTELLISICRRFPAGDALPQEFYEVTATIGSDSEMRRALAQLAGRPLTSGDLARALRLSRDIGSDFELAELLIGLVDQLPEGEPLPPELYDAIGTIGSDHEMARVLGRLIDRPLGDDDLVRVLETSRQIGSDFELAELLVGLVRRHGDPVGARSAFEATADIIGSSAERARVLDAWRHAGA